MGEPTDAVLGERRPKEEVPVMTLNVYRVRHSITTTQSTDPVKGLLLTHGQAYHLPFAQS